MYLQYKAITLLDVAFPIHRISSGVINRFILLPPPAAISQDIIVLIRL